MKSILLGAGLLAFAFVGAGAANAQVNVEVGPGYHHNHHWWRHYDREGRCRTIITHRMNGRGDRVTVRKRVCD